MYQRRVLVHYRTRHLLVKAFCLHKLHQPGLVLRSHHHAKIFKGVQLRNIVFQFTENQVSIPHDIVNVKKTLGQSSPLCLVLYK